MKKILTGVALVGAVALAMTGCAADGGNGGGGGGGGGVLSFLRKRKESKENLFGEKLRFSKKGGVAGARLGQVGSAFTKPTLPWGAWKGLGGG